MTKESHGNWCQVIISHKSNKEEIKSMEKELYVRIQEQFEIKELLSSAIISLHHKLTLRSFIRQ